MSQEKKGRNLRIYKDRKNGMTWRALEDKYGIARNQIIAICERYQLKEKAEK